MQPQPCTPCSGSAVNVSVPGPAGASGPQIGYTTAFGSGTVYTMTASSALLNLGTTTPSVTLAQAGTYLLFARARFDGVGATLTTQTLTTKIRRTNNTAADVSNTTRVFDFVPSTTTSGTMAEISLLAVPYVATAGDTLQLWGGLSGLPGAGSITCVEADIVAIQIALS